MLLEDFLAELLPEQRFHVRLVIDNQQPHGHVTGLARIWRDDRAFGVVVMLPPGCPEP